MNQRLFQYIVINLSINTLLHVLVWSAMLGTSPAVYLLAWTRDYVTNVVEFSP